MVPTRTNALARVLDSSRVPRIVRCMEWVPYQNQTMSLRRRAYMSCALLRRGNTSVGKHSHYLLPFEGAQSIVSGHVTMPSRPNEMILSPQLPYSATHTGVLSPIMKSPPLYPVNVLPWSPCTLPAEKRQSASRPQPIQTRGRCSIHDSCVAQRGWEQLGQGAWMTRPRSLPPESSEYWRAVVATVHSLCPAWIGIPIERRNGHSCVDPLEHKVVVMPLLANRSCIQPWGMNLPVALI